MAQLISAPTRIQAAGTPPKTIEEFIGGVTSQTTGVSIARMTSPPGWEEPGQTPAFYEYSVVLKGMLRVTTKSGVLDVKAGQAVITPKDEWVKYATPEGAEYIAVCLPAFSPAAVNRDA